MFDLTGRINGVMYVSSTNSEQDNIILKQRA